MSSSDNYASASRETWRIFRIMAEFVEGFGVLSEIGPAVSVFGSARTPQDREDYHQGVELGRKLADAGFAVITGGGPGTMEAVNKGAFQAGGTSIGLNIVIPQEQVANRYLTVDVNFDYFFARKVMFVKYAVGVICLPGGFGTLDELFETLTLIQTQKTPPSPVVLIGTSYWTGLIDWVRETMLKKYASISPGDLDLFLLTDDLDQAVAHIGAKCTFAGPLWTSPEHQTIRRPSKAVEPRRS